MAIILTLPFFISNLFNIVGSSLVVVHSGARLDSLASLFLKVYIPETEINWWNGYADNPPGFVRYWVFPLFFSLFFSSTWLSFPPFSQMLLLPVIDWLEKIRVSIRHFSVVHSSSPQTCTYIINRRTNAKIRIFHVISTKKHLENFYKQNLIWNFKCKHCDGF